MSKSSALAYELDELREQAWDAAMQLEDKINEIRDLLWQDQDNEPMFRAPGDVLQTLKVIQQEIARPIEEIRAAA